jgi:hypothetical protein
MRDALQLKTHRSTSVFILLLGPQPLAKQPSKVCSRVHHIQVSAGALGFGTLYWTFYGQPGVAEKQQVKAVNTEARSPQLEALERELQLTSSKVWGISQPGNQDKS